MRTALGLALFAGGLTFLCYGIAQAIENGSCGTDEEGRVLGPPCPSGFGAMIGLMVLGAFVALAGSALFSSRRPGLGGVAIVVGVMRFFAAAFLAATAATVLALIDVHSDDTRPGLEIVAVVCGAVLLLSLPGLLRRPDAAPLITVEVDTGSEPEAAAPPPAASRDDTARAEDIASRLRQLEQLKESGLLAPDEYDRRRGEILAEL